MVWVTGLPSVLDAPSARLNSVRESTRLPFGCTTKIEKAIAGRHLVIDVELLIRLQAVRIENKRGHEGRQAGIRVWQQMPNARLGIKSISTQKLP